MNDGRNERSKFSAIERRLPAFACMLLFLLGVFALLFWLSAPTHDPRLIGDWRDTKGMIWRFHPDGQLERIVPRSPANGWEPWRLAPWRTEGDELFIGGKQTPVMQVMRLIDRRLHRPAYQIMVVTDSTLRLRRTTPLPLPPPLLPGRPGAMIRAEEVLTREPAAAK
jgi:hypothetical protein